MAAGYVEIIRNLPLLLQLLFWYNAVLESAAEFPRQLSISGGALLNNRGLFLPRPIFGPAFEAVPIAFAVGLVGALVFRIWARAPANGHGTTGAGARCKLVVDRWPAARWPSRSPAFR